MSSANRGRSRNLDDLYESPHWIIEAEIPRLKSMLTGIEHPTIWEPCAGNGRITRVLKYFFPEATIYSTDLQEYKGIDRQLDFLQAMDTDYPFLDEPDLIISNPPFCIARQIIQHAQKLVHEEGHVVFLERLGFLGTKKREKWLRAAVPDIDVSPRRASFLPTGQTDSIEYAWMSWRSVHADRPQAACDTGWLHLLPTMMCSGCGETHYEKTCKSCDYGYCKSCLPDHDCKRNLFGKESLWYCINHPKVPMDYACKAKGCSLPFCNECWEEHHNDTGKAICLETD